MNDNKVESGRCLLCKKPRCSANCPVHTPVPEAMALYRAGKLREAGELLFGNNPLSAVTSRVCDWKNLCFGHCVLSVKDIPVHWYSIEQEISGRYLLDLHMDAPAMNAYSVAVVGAGPAGITAALSLRQKGCQVTIFDDKARPGGVLRYGIPSFRLDTRYVDAYERLLAETGVQFKGNVRIGKNITLDALLTAFDAVLLATGAWSPRKLDIPGEDSPKVIYALEYLENPSEFELRDPVIVVGGGNVTMDASRTAVRSGHDTCVYYRKTFGNMPANSEEVKAAVDDGVKFELFQVPVAVEGDSLVIRRCENITNDDGSVRTRMIEGSDFRIPFGTMIVAISENVDYGILGEPGPELDNRGRIFVNSLQQTSIPGLFLAGDFLTGPRTVVEAVSTARTAVEGISDFLGLK